MIQLPLISWSSPSLSWSLPAQWAIPRQERRDRRLQTWRDIAEMPEVDAIWCDPGISGRSGCTAPSYFVKYLGCAFCVFHILDLNPGRKLTNLTNLAEKQQHLVFQTCVFTSFSRGRIVIAVSGSIPWLLRSPEILSSGWHLTWSTCIEMIHIKKRSNKINKAQHIKGSHVWAVYMLLFLKKTCFINFHLGLNMVDTGLDLLFMISGYFWIFLDELNHVIPLKIMIFRWPPVRWRGHKRPKSGDGAWAVAKSCATNLGWFKA